MNGFVNQASKILMLDSYSAFVANVNTTSLDSAFGKNNEAFVHDLGLQLAMYAWFAGDSESLLPYSNLRTKATLSDCIGDELSLYEMLSSEKITILISTSPYANGMLTTYLSSSNNLLNFLVSRLGIDSETYTTLSSVFASGTVMDSIANDKALLYAISRSGSSILGTLFSSWTAREALWNNVSSSAVLMSSSHPFRAYMYTNLITTLSTANTTVTTLSNKKGFILGVWGANSNRVHHFGAIVPSEGDFKTQSNVELAVSLRVNPCTARISSATTTAYCKFVQMQA